MVNSLMPLYPKQLDLATLTTADLRAELARGLTLTAEVLVRLGAVWQELERRGEDLSDLRTGIARTLPLIAGGQLAAEAVVAFSGRPALLRALEGVPLERQREFAAGKTIEVIDPTRPDGVASMQLSHLPVAAIRLVFADGEVRSPAMQRLAFRPRKLERKEAERRFRPRYDATAGTVTIGRMTFQLADLLREVAQTNGPEPAIIHKEEYVQLKLRLTRDEAKRLEAAARNAELPDWEVVRKALRAFGLI